MHRAAHPPPTTNKCGAGGIPFSWSPSPHPPHPQHSAFLCVGRWVAVHLSLPLHGDGCSPIAALALAGWAALPTRFLVCLVWWEDGEATVFASCRPPFSISNGSFENLCSPPSSSGEPGAPCVCVCGMWGMWLYSGAVRLSWRCGALVVAVALVGTS